MKFETIDQVFVFLRMDGSQSLALLDCMNAYAEGTGALEQHFDTHLWVDANAPEIVDPVYDQYYKELGRIEEFLVMQGLIYEDDAFHTAE